jgi:hypothetical protein
VAKHVARATAVLAGAAGIASGCGNAGADRVLTIDATGQVAGFVFFDQNGTLQFDEDADRRVPGVVVRLALAGGGTVVAQGTSDNEGLFRVTGVPVGNYVVLVDTATVGDTAQVVRVDSMNLRLQPEDSIGITVAIGFPNVMIVEARALPAGDKIFVTGVALSPLGAFGDSTVHVRDASATIRATRVGGVGVNTGDSARFLGRRNVRDGQPTLDDVIVFSLGVVGQPEAVQVTTAGAATAEGGPLDAALVRVTAAAILDTLRNQSGDYVMRADDGSGRPVEVIVDVNLGINLSGFVPGATIDATGVLVPTDQQVPLWGMKPRNNQDLRVVASP